MWQDQWWHRGYFLNPSQHSSLSPSMWHESSSLELSCFQQGGCSTDKGCWRDVTSPPFLYLWFTFLAAPAWKTPEYRHSMQPNTWHTGGWWEWFFKTCYILKRVVSGPCSHQPPLHFLSFAHNRCGRFSHRWNLFDWQETRVLALWLSWWWLSLSFQLHLFLESETVFFDTMETFQWDWNVRTF